MKLPKFLLIISAITFISCLYVYQQTEILRLAYIGQKKKAIFEDLLDKNSFLRYNVEKGFSLVRIGNRFSNVADFQMPDTYRLVRLASIREELKPRAQRSKKQNLLSLLFGIKRQAEAKTINASTRLSVDGERSRTINP